MVKRWNRMLFKQWDSQDSGNMLKEKIRYDLIETFKRKGINICDIKIDMTADSINVSACITEKCDSAV